MDQLIGVFVTAVTVALAFFVWHFFREVRTLRTRYSTAADEAQNLRIRYASSIDLDGELAVARKQLEQIKRDQQGFDSENEQRRSRLNQEYQQALATYKELKEELALLEENFEDMSYGVYKPHFTFETPDEYRTALACIRDHERLLVRDGKAALCPVAWRVGNSDKEGARMITLHTKLVLRAFNGECEGAIADVSWNNITKMEERIRKAFQAVNKLGEVLQLSVTEGYLKLKLDELRLKHEYETKRYEEREEQRRIREQIREEEKAQREIEKAREEAEIEEARYQKALEKAREEAARATGLQLQKLIEQINSFESKLDEARQKKERAISRAQVTKSGFVYVISNLGSFGDHVYKIGMRRRMEPMERIFELSGASVPFPFDLHAMLYSDNAPELENSLHQLFEPRRFNLVNRRREFYRNVELDEIESFVRTRGLSAQFIRHPEAREYRETLAKQRQQLKEEASKEAQKFSGDLFPPASATA